MRRITLNATVLVAVLSISPLAGAERIRGSANPPLVPPNVKVGTYDLSATDLEALAQARVLVAEGALERAEHTYRDATYAYLWSSVFPSKDAMMAIREYLRLLKKMHRQADVKAVEARFRYFEAPNPDGVTVCPNVLIPVPPNKSE